MGWFHGVCLWEIGDELSELKAGTLEDDPDLKFGIDRDIKSEA
jgi:hypothetical protein